MKFRNFLLILLIIFVTNIVSAQCYIQYTYDASGNRIKREYVGCSAKPAPKDHVEEMVNALLSDSILGVRTEIIRNDLENNIRVYPNPTFDKLNIQSDHADLIRLYTITTLNGQQIIEGSILDHTTLVDLSNYLPGTYILTIRSPDHQIIYSTSIIKQ